MRVRFILYASIAVVGVVSPSFAQQSVEAVVDAINRLPSAERQTQLVEGARKEGVVEWYATLPFDQSRPVMEGFERRYPFIKVKYTRGGGTSLVNRVITEHRGSVDRVDVLGGTSFSHASLMEAGLLARNMAPFRSEIREGFADANGYRVAPFTYAMVIGYNSRAVPPEERPRSYTDLLQPKWKGQMALDREAHEWLAGLIDTMGEEEALAFARKLATQNIMMQRGHTLMTQMVIAGEVKLVVDGYHYQIENFKQKGAPVDYVITDPLLVKNPSAIWLMKYAPHPYSAALLIDFLFSREGQEEYAKQNRLVARKDMPWDFRARVTGRSHILSPEKWGKRYNDLIKEFDNIFRN
jgi:iron(III) transport system substrate-binding protein